MLRQEAFNLANNLAAVLTAQAATPLASSTPAASAGTPLPPTGVDDADSLAATATIQAVQTQLVRVQATQTAVAPRNIAAPAGLYLREGPSTDYSPIAVLPDNAAIEVLDRQGDWLYVRVEGQIGYIYSDYATGSTSHPESNTISDVPSNSPASQRICVNPATATRKRTIDCKFLEPVP